METEVSQDEFQKIDEGICPDCGGRLMMGPRGGAAMNIKCEKCDATFWVAPGWMPVRLEVEAISK